MDHRLLRRFQDEVAQQCEYILFAAENLDRDLVAEGRPAFLLARIWFDVQNLVLAAATVSRLLWGQKDKTATARADLRLSLGVADSSPLKSRQIRDAFEHIDERFETWSQSAKPGFADRNVMAPAMLNIGSDREDWFRHLDPTTGELTFWGLGISLREVVAEARRIQPIAKAEAEKA